MGSKREICTVGEQGDKHIQLSSNNYIWKIFFKIQIVKGKKYWDKV